MAQSTKAALVFGALLCALLALFGAGLAAVFVYGLIAMVAFGQWRLLAGTLALSAYGVLALLFGALGCSAPDGVDPTSARGQYCDAGGDWVAPILLTLTPYVMLVSKWLGRRIGSQRLVRLAALALAS